MKVGWHYCRGKLRVFLSHVGNNHKADRQHQGNPTFIYTAFYTLVFTLSINIEYDIFHDIFVGLFTTPFSRCLATGTISS